MKHALLGANVTDRVSGFTGTVTGFVDYITGCQQVLVAPRVTGQGDFRSSEWFDVQRVVVNEETPPIVLDDQGHNGADKSPPRR